MVTFVIPTIGRPSLEQAVLSVYNQTIPCKLLVLWDSERQGAYATRNRALDTVKTEWTAFLDDDDTVDPRYGEWLEAELESNPDAVVFRMLQKGADQPIPRPGPLTNGNIGISFAVKTDIFRHYPFPEPTISEIEDYLLIKRLQDAGCTIRRSPRIAYFVGGFNE